MEKGEKKFKKVRMRKRGSKKRKRTSMRWAEGRRSPEGFFRRTNFFPFCFWISKMKEKKGKKRNCLNKKTKEREIREEEEKRKNLVSKKESGV